MTTPQPPDANAVGAGLGPTKLDPAPVAGADTSEPSVRTPLEDHIRSRGYIIQPTPPEREDITVKHLMNGEGWVLDVIDLACALIHERQAAAAEQERAVRLERALVLMQDADHTLARPGKPDCQCFPHRTMTAALAARAALPTDPQP